MTPEDNIVVFSSFNNQIAKLSPKIMFIRQGSHTMNIFNEMGSYWAEMADKRQTEAQVAFIQNHLKPDGLILDLACGTARHLALLTKKGFNMVGLDASPNLLRIAKNRKRKIQVVLADLRFLPFKDQTFAAAVSMDTSFGYLSSMKADKQCLDETHRVMKHGGRLIIDVFNRKYQILKNREKSSLTEWREYPSFFLKQERTLTLNGQHLRDLWTIRSKRTGHLIRFRHLVRLYSEDSLKDLLEKTSFAFEKGFGSYKSEDLSLDSSRLIVIGKAK